MTVGSSQIIFSNFGDTSKLWSTDTSTLGTEVDLALPSSAEISFISTDGQGNFVACADANKYAYSNNDGATWAFVTPPGGVCFPTAFDGEKFIAYGNNSQHSHYSTDKGATWSYGSYWLRGTKGTPCSINGICYTVVPEFGFGTPDWGYLERTPAGGISSGGYAYNAGHPYPAYYGASPARRPLVTNGIDTIITIPGGGGVSAFLTYIHRPWAHEGAGFLGVGNHSTSAAVVNYITDEPLDFHITVVYWKSSGSWEGYGYWTDDPGFVGSTYGTGVGRLWSTDRGVTWSAEMYPSNAAPRVYPTEIIDNPTGGKKYMVCLPLPTDAGNSAYILDKDLIGYLHPDDVSPTSSNFSLAGPEPMDYHEHGEGGIDISGTGAIAFSLHLSGTPDGITISGSGDMSTSLMSESDEKRHHRKRLSTRKNHFSYGHNVNNRTQIFPWDLEQSQQCAVIADATALLRVSPPEVLPATGYFPPYIQRHSELYYHPTITHGKPQRYWLPYQTIQEDWGHVRVLVNGKDMTYFRDVPCVIENWQINEPFGDASASILFPQITPFEHPRVFMPRWSPVQIQIVRPGGVIDDLFDGMLTAYHDNGVGTGITVTGAFYESDFLLRRPTFQDENIDITNHITTTINGFIMLYGLNLSQMDGPLTGITRRARGYFEKTATGYIQNLLGFLQDSGGDPWTIECKSRQPRLVIRDRTTIHWSVMNGARGVDVNLEQDLIADPNVIFGEGVSTDNQYWRNTKYPGLFDPNPPLWPGFNFGYGDSGDFVLLWAAAANRLGYGATMSEFFDQASADSCTQLQMDNGLTVTGTVTAQTWARTFDIGANNGDIGSVYIQPLAWYKYVEPALFNADGGITGLNPDYDPSIPRIERYINYGPGITKSMGIDSAVNQIARDYFIKGWKGTLTLKSDPGEGSRFEIRPNQNIQLRHYRNGDQLLHIAKVVANFHQGDVQLTVDTKARDLPTIAAQYTRDHEALQDPGSKFKTYRGLSYNKEDRWPMWDSESGCGIVPLHWTTAQTWNVLRIPFGKYGEIVVSDFQTDPICKFSICAFSSPIFPNTVAGFGDPMNTENFYDNLDAYRLVWAYGAQSVKTGKLRMGGFDPVPTNQDPSNTPLTGRILDKAPWTYGSDFPPWMYIGIWTEIQTRISGRFYPGTKSGEGLPVVFGTPAPDQGGGGG